MKIRYSLLFITSIIIFFSSCMDYGPMDEENFDSIPLSEGLFITNEGNFMYGNASLSYYIPSEKRVENEIFARANGQKLGDVAQSMIKRNGLGYIVVNNSGVIYVVDINTFKVKGEITGLISPRGMLRLITSSSRIMPSPEQCVHFFVIVLPSPLQVGQVD